MTVRFASVLALLQTARRTLQRFPFVLIAAVAAAAISHYFVDLDVTPTDRQAALLLACSLGIALFFSLRLLAESRGWSRPRALGLAAGGVLALAGYYLALPDPLHGADAFRFALIAAGLHLWVAVAPYSGRSYDEDAFWSYNRTLFLRFTTAVLYSFVLFVGLALALAACETLLGLAVDEETYFKLWLWIAWVYNTWFFLAGIPTDVPALRDARGYPTGLRVFTQYVLIPLVVIYLLILYIYLAKIIVTWELPRGWVGYPVIGVSVTGVLALLLVHPIRERTENAWIRSYGRFFYLALFPLIGLVAVAIGVRIDAYGITENRYLVVVLTAWLAAMALLFSLRPASRISILPLSLCAVILLSAVGPWGAAAVARRDQLGRMRELLRTHQLLVDDRLTADPKRAPFDARVEISNIVTYLHEWHGLEALRAWYSDPDQLPDTASPKAAVQAMGLQYVPPRTRREQLVVYSNRPNPVRLDGYDYLYTLNRHLPDADARRQFDLEETGLYVTVGGDRLIVTPRDQPLAALTLPLDSLLATLSREPPETRTSMPGDAMTLSRENERLRLRAHIERINAAARDDRLRIHSLTATLLIDDRALPPR